MMPHPARTFVTLLLFTVLVPGIAVLAMYVVLHQQVVAKYNSCVAALNPEQRRSPGLELVIDDLRRVVRFQGTRWNLNAPYDATAVNILISSSADPAWDERCGLPPAPADCLAAARERFVICNAIVGHQLMDPRMSRGVVRDEIVRARRFLALAFLGHELGHLTRGSPDTLRHLYPTNRIRGLQCTTPSDAGPSEEQRADAFGVDVACEALKKNPDLISIPTDVQAAVFTLSHLRDALDEDYFAFDDTCHSDPDYPSMSRRKSTFALEYAKCLFPGRDLPYAPVAGDQTAAFQVLEKWLREHQISGIVGSALYGTGAPYHFQVAETSRADCYVAFDSAGRYSQIAMTAIVGDKLAHAVLASWDQAGEVVDAHTTSPASDTFLLSFAAPENGTDIRLVTLTCTSAKVRCSATQATRHLRAGIEVRATASHVVVEVAGRHVRTFASAGDYLADRAVLDLSVKADLRSSATLLDGGASKLVVAEQPSDPHSSYGFHRIGTITPAGLRWTVFSTLPTAPLGSVSAILVLPVHVAFLLAPPPSQWGGRTKLWLCPTSALNAIGVPGERAVCDVYDPPQELDTPIGIANNDLDSLGMRITYATSCRDLIQIRKSGWIWLLDPGTHQQEAIPGAGLVGCADDHSHAVVYRMRRIDDVRLELSKTPPSQASMAIVKSTYVDR
jgi:hypothetical protein